MELYKLLFLFEIPFFSYTAILTYMVAKKMGGAAVGRGMRLITYGMIGMAVGHLYMIIEQVTGIALFQAIFGLRVGLVVLVIYLVGVWIFFIAGFQKFLKS